MNNLIRLSLALNAVMTRKSSHHSSRLEASRKKDVINSTKMQRKTRKALTNSSEKSSRGANTGGRIDAEDNRECSLYPAKQRSAENQEEQELS